ncbi:MAG: hypothetical protein ACFE9Z_13470 [Promethearchaeota archaeon]
MSKSKGYIVALIAGILGIIVLFTPIAFHESGLAESYIWMWGLYTWKPVLGDTSFYFSEDFEFLIWGLLTTLLILIATISLILTGKKASKRNKNYGFLWIICGLLFIGAPLVFYFGLSSEMPSWLSDLFWNIYSFHFAFYGSFIAGGLAILSAILK